MKSRFALLRVWLLLTLLTPLPSFAAAVFPQDESDLPPDPAIRWGRLDNGVRYAILPNPEPKGRASVQLAIGAGTLNETEDQRGLAHFVEHMAFNGSKHFAPGTMVEFFQRLGMSFGGDTNAFTGFDRTVYRLELPETTPARFTDAFTYLADVAGGLLLLETEIDKERGVILSEKRTRDSVEERQFIGEFEFLLPEARFSQRLPIGLEPVISGASRARFTDFYDTWYRPELMTVVAVGDFDPAAVEAQLKTFFAPISARAPAQPAPDRGRIADLQGLTARLLSEPEAAVVRVAIKTVTPYAHEADNAAHRLQYLPRSLALNMVNRRLAILAKQEGAPFLVGGIGAAEQYDFFRVGSVDLACKPEHWRAALAVGEQELRRALQFGFQPAELKEAVATLRNGLEQAVKTAPTRRSGQLAGELAGSVIDQSVFVHPATELALFGPVLDKVTVENCVAALRQLWPDNLGRRLWVTGNLKLDGAPEPQIVAAYEASRAVAVTPPAKVAEAAFAYTHFGPAGEVAKSETVADLGATLIEFKNGVRLNLKPTDFEAGRISVSVRVGGGKLTEPPAQVGLAFFAQHTLLLGGLGQHAADDLQRLLAGRTVATNFAIDDDAFQFGATTNRADLPLQFQLLCAYLTDPGYRTEGQRQLRQFLAPFYTRLANTVEGPLQTDVPRLLASGDPRFGVPPQAAAVVRTNEEVKSWLAPEFTHGALEVAIVGDFDPAAVIAAAAQTFGALPARNAKPAYAAQRKVAFPAQPLAHQFSVPSEIPKGVVQLVWPATDRRDVRLARRLNLLGSVFNDRLRLKIREELGDGYAPNVGANLSDAYPGYGFFAASTVVAPDKARAVADAIRAAAAALAAHGVTEEELVRAKQPVLAGIKQSVRINAYWLASVLSAAQEQPERLDWARTRLADTEAITAAELTALAQQYLDPAKASEFLSLPAPKKTE
ncbi:MAG: insulinase family protein [Opitutae bacterium]|nr:insulinase family protein [Opitutae bacterium]